MERTSSNKKHGKITTEKSLKNGEVIEQTEKVITEKKKHSGAQYKFKTSTSFSTVASNLKKIVSSFPTNDKKTKATTVFSTIPPTIEKTTNSEEFTVPLFTKNKEKGRTNKHHYSSELHNISKNPINNMNFSTKTTIVPATAKNNSIATRTAHISTSSVNDTVWHKINWDVERTSHTVSVSETTELESKFLFNVHIVIYSPYKIECICKKCIIFKGY